MSITIRRKKNKMDLSGYYTRMMGKLMANSTDNLIFGTVTKYRNKRVPVYLRIPTLSIQKDYDYDSEYGTGGFRGILISLRWLETKIRIGEKTVKVPVYKKPTGTIKFRRYGELENDTK